MSARTSIYRPNVSLEKKRKILVRARRLRDDGYTWAQITAVTGKSDTWLQKHLKGF